MDDGGLGRAVRVGPKDDDRQGLADTTLGSRTSVFTTASQLGHSRQDDGEETRRRLIQPSSMRRRRGPAEGRQHASWMTA